MPPRHWASLGFAAIAAVCLTPGVFAAPLPPPPPPLDDHPAPPPPPATKAEAEARARRMFAAVDADHDGYVTRAEADAGRQRLRMMMMARRPGAGRADGFDRLDTDRDGNISRAEFAARRPGPAAGAAGAVDISGGRERVSRELPPPPRPGPPPPRHGKMPPPPPPPSPHDGGHAGMMTGPMFDRMDGDHDGRISLAEAVAAADRHFALRPDRRMLRRDGNPRPMERPPG